jgi:dGTPase
MKLGLRALHFEAAVSRGRRYPEPPHPYRNEFQRDRDRIVHARAFRRLEDKTQVFPPALSDHFRNRLTHTIEVAQIARTVACVLDLNQDLTEALALAHDIGHPPFAHAGEEALDRQMQPYGLRFDHNLHALRIVEHFEQRYARFPGLNLTFEVREGIVKHSRDFAPGEVPELDEYLPGLRPPLEAQIIDLADEIAYNTADLDDAFSAGLFDLHDIAAAVPYFARILDEVDTQFPGASERTRFLEALRLLIDLLVGGLIEGTYSAVTGAQVENIEQLRAWPSRLAVFTPEAAATRTALKGFLHRRVYSSEALQQERRRISRRIANLFTFFLQHPDHLPEPYRSQADGDHLPRVVCDYIAGMTDRFFRRTYERILGNDL